MTDFHQRGIGRRAQVRWEDAEIHGGVRRWSGLTGNYIRVLTETDVDVDLTNEITEVELDADIPGAMLGTVPGISRSGIEETSRRVSASLPVVGS